MTVYDFTFTWTCLFWSLSNLSYFYIISYSRRLGYYNVTLQQRNSLQGCTVTLIVDDLHIFRIDLYLPSSKILSHIRATIREINLL